MGNIELTMKPAFEKSAVWTGLDKAGSSFDHDSGLAGLAGNVFAPSHRLSESSYQKIRDIVYNYSGIDLTDRKKALIVGRLQKILRTRGLKNFSEYIDYLESDKTGNAIVELINNISTNHSYFYREHAHFEYFAETVLPEAVAALKKNGSNDIRVWSAGCSTGEEAYMLVMLMLDFFGQDYPHWNAGILATDISTKVLTTALEGVYSEERLGQLPDRYKQKYFQKTGEMTWAIDKRAKNEVTFRRFNLMTSEFPFKKQFHVIFCRNVMIYFDIPTRNRIIEKFHQVTCPGGYLFIGHSESLGRDQGLYKFVKPAVYRKKG